MTIHSVLSSFIPVIVWTKNDTFRKKVSVDAKLNKKIFLNI